MQNSSTARGASSPFHIALHSSKKFAVYYTSEETHSRAYMPASISCQRAPIPANRYRLKCLPVQGSATMIWSHVASNKKPGVERRAYPSLLRAIYHRGPRTEVLEARFETTRSTLPISPLDERQTRSVSAHTALTSACRHSSIVSETRSSSSIFLKFFWHSSVENPVHVDIAKSPLKMDLFGIFDDPNVPPSDSTWSVSFRNSLDVLRLRCCFAFVTIRGFLPAKARSSLPNAPEDSCRSARNAAQTLGKAPNSAAPAARL